MNHTVLDWEKDQPGRENGRGDKTGPEPGRPVSGAAEAGEGFGPLPGAAPPTPFVGEGPVAAEAGEGFGPLPGADPPKPFTGEGPVAAIATPPGLGGICCVRISGAGAHAIADRVFRPANPRKTVAGAPGYTALFGHFLRGGQVKDQCIALVFRAPKSYTGEDVAELSCHGGAAVARELLLACLEAGAAPAGPGEFTRRAFVNGKLSLTQAEAVGDMIAATSRQGVAAAAAALDGALYRALDGACIQPLLALQGHIAAFTDFPDEEVEGLGEGEARAVLAAAHGALCRLIDGYDTGAILRRGVDTAIVGRPNVGKSTLLNRLAGYDRAIVTPVAGTTRDVVQQSVSLAGVELILSDTAGVRTTDDPVEKEGIRRAWGAMDVAGLVLAVFDASQPLTDQDIELARRCEGRPALAVVNKADLPRRLDISPVARCFKEVVVISADRAGSLPPLEAAVSRVLGISHIDPGAGMLANQRQLSAAITARDALADALEAQDLGFSPDVVGVCVDDALSALFALTGRQVSESVVEEIFSKFCVGK